MMGEDGTRTESLQARIEEVQERIREVTKERARLFREGRQAELEAVDRRLVELRQQRQALLDEQFRLEREASGEREEPVPGSGPVVTRYRVQGARGGPPMAVRILMLLVIFGGVAVVLVGAILYGVERFLVPPPIEGMEGDGSGIEDEFVPREGQSAEERLLALYLAANRDAIMRAPSDDPSPVTFRIESGESGAVIAEHLEEAQLVEDAELFRRLLRYRGADQSLEAGTYVLARNMTMDEIIVALQEGREEEVTFTLLEGWRAEEMARALEASGLVASQEYMDLVRNPAHFEHTFLREIPDGMTLEGYLFPDTYTVFREGITAESIIRMQLDTFDRRVPQTLRDAATARGMSLYEAVTLASIVEREAVVSEEKAIIAGVYINRWLDGTILNADPTVQYALGYQEAEESWWKRPLTGVDLQIDSPYNTYIVPGLPPGPISSPGLDTLQATIEAPPTEFYYFVSRNDGTHVFASTLEEHIENVQLYQGGD